MTQRRLPAAEDQAVKVNTTPQAAGAAQSFAPAAPKPVSRPFVHVLQEGSPPTPLPARTLATPPVGRVLEASFAAETKLDALIAAATRGKAFTAAELIALQAEVFRYSQVVEVVARTTDKVVGAVKQVLGTPV